MLTREALDARRDLVQTAPDLQRLFLHLVARAAPLFEREVVMPRVKALLSRDGGVCPDDGSVLSFDPWSPHDHRCGSCEKVWRGARHDLHWARAQHLWIAERAAHLATLAAMSDDPRYASRALDLMRPYYALYFDLPNRDNVLGPTHLFFSTYLESIWLLDFLAAAFMLRELQLLEADDITAVDRIAEEAAKLIGEFNEGLSNRQTWNSAAMIAIAAWFADDELAMEMIESRTGLLGHLADGFGADGMWFEGENYHLFALRGWLIGLQWATTAGADLLENAAVATHLGEALLAPAWSALPDLTFPARKDSRFGVSLAHPAYLECWEAGLAVLGPGAPDKLPSWLRALYLRAAHEEQTYDAWLHDAGTSFDGTRSRTALSWWALLTMPASLPEAESWQPESRLLSQQGLAVMRNSNRYLSLECGGSLAGGHGHPDRLHVTLHADGIHWLADPGTGSYVTRDLFWYRSTLAHNAPRIDGHDQVHDSGARCTAFATDGEWSRAEGTWNGVRRTLIGGPRWIADIVQCDGETSHRYELPWHPNGQIAVATPGEWQSAEEDDEFVTHHERWVPAQSGPVRLTASARGQALDLWLDGAAELVRAIAPGIPGSGDAQAFVLQRSDARTARFVTLLAPGGMISGMQVDGNTVRVAEVDTVTVIECNSSDTTIVSGSARLTLSGEIARPARAVGFMMDQPSPTAGRAVWVDTPPALDGTLNGFLRTAPLRLNDELRYFRSEEEYPGTDAFAAVGFLNWSEHDLFLAVDIVKPDVRIRADELEPLNLDNEPDDIHTDSIQVYVRGAAREQQGWLIRPLAGGRIIARITGTEQHDALHGAWAATPLGYRITVRLPAPGLMSMHRMEKVGFDLMVNEARADRVRRAGQLVWSGGPGWVYLRGDRNDARRMGQVELVG